MTLDENSGMKELDGWIEQVSLAPGTEYANCTQSYVNFG